MAEKVPLDASQPWNIVVVVSDTLRTAYLGAYGNKWIHTPNLDRFAQDSVRFTNAHPECLPTIPTRRTLHSGRGRSRFGITAPYLGIMSISQVGSRYRRTRAP